MLSNLPITSYEIMRKLITWSTHYYTTTRVKSLTNFFPTPRFVPTPLTRSSVLNANLRALGTPWCHPHIVCMNLQGLLGLISDSVPFIHGCFFRRPVEGYLNKQICHQKDYVVPLSLLNPSMYCTARAAAAGAYVSMARQSPQELRNGTTATSLSLEESRCERDSKLTKI